MLLLDNLHFSWIAKESEHTRNKLQAFPPKKKHHHLHLHHHFSSNWLKIGSIWFNSDRQHKIFFKKKKSQRIYSVVILTIQSQSKHQYCVHCVTRISAKCSRSQISQWICSYYSLHRAFAVSTYWSKRKSSAYVQMDHVQMDHVRVSHDKIVLYLCCCVWSMLSALQTFRITQTTRAAIDDRDKRAEKSTANERTRDDERRK